MKILFALHQFFPLHHTGTERFTLDLAKQLQRMGHFVTVLTYEPSYPIIPSKEKKFLYNTDAKVKNDDFKSFSGSKTLLKKEYQVESVPVISFKHKTSTLGFDLFDEEFHFPLTEIISNFDLVHITHPMRFTEALKVCKEQKKPIVLTITDSWLLCPRGLLTSKKELCHGPDEGKNCKSLCHYGDEIDTRYNDTKYFFDNVDTVVSGSNFMRHVYYENGWTRKILLNTFSVDYSFVKNIPAKNDKTVFCFIGTLSWHKGPHVLINAFSKIKNKNIELKIYGRGDGKNPYIHYLEDLVDNDNRIEFCGTFDYSELPQIMKNISCVVIPSSYMENYPLVMQLALAYRKPVIASKIGGMPEVIQNGVNGYLFDIGQVSELSKIIHNISENPSVLQQIQDTITIPPSVETEAFNYEQIYQNLLDSKN